MTTSISDLETYFNRIGFQYRSVDGNKIRTGIRYPIPYYNSGMPVEIVFDEYWVTVRGVVLNGIPESNFDAILAYIATASARMRVLRMMVASRKVLIQGELIRSRTDLGATLEVMSAMIRYGASHALELSAIAANSSVARAFMHIQQRAACVPRSPGAFNESVDFDILTNRINDLVGAN